MHFVFVDVILLFIRYQTVSVADVAIFRVNFNQNYKFFQL
jgi:hypothetical protein